jgi:beta-lactamase class D
MMNYRFLLFDPLVANSTGLYSLFALDAGFVRNEFQVFEWDGVERDFAPHNRDQDLRSAMRNSTV